MNKYKCGCGKDGVWMYIHECKYNPYYCDDCVPRYECSCNLNEYTELHIDEDGEQNYREVYTTMLDENGKLVPCMDYSYIGDSNEI